MKAKPILLLIAILLIIESNASVRTVNNTNTGAAQYLQIDPAIAASNPGDTIYVVKSTTAYDNFTITKSITIIGPGIFQQTQNPISAVLSTATINNNISSITIRGFLFIGQIIGGAGAMNNVHQVIITDNYFVNNYAINLGGLTNCSDFTISNNIFSGGDALAASNVVGSYNFIFQNNLMSMSKINSFNFPNGIIQNNTFCNTDNGNAFIGLTTGITIKNNIFYNSHPNNNTVSCTFLNNISYSTTLTYPVLGGTNIDNVDPLFVNVANTGGFSKSYNYNVQTSSPAHNGGSDGTDLGFYGGGVHVSERGEPQFFPVVRAMNLDNNNVLQNGNVNVKVRSTKAR